MYNAVMDLRLIFFAFHSQNETFFSSTSYPLAKKK